MIQRLNWFHFCHYDSGTWEKHFSVIESHSLNFRTVWGYFQLLYLDCSTFHIPHPPHLWLWQLHKVTKDTTSTQKKAGEKGKLRNVITICMHFPVVSHSINRSLSPTDYQLTMIHFVFISEGFSLRFRPFSLFRQTLPSLLSRFVCCCCWINENEKHRNTQCGLSAIIKCMISFPRTLTTLQSARIVGCLICSTQTGDHKSSVDLTKKNECKSPLICSSIVCRFMCRTTRYFDFPIDTWHKPFGVVVGELKLYSAHLSDVNAKWRNENETDWCRMWGSESEERRTLKLKRICLFSWFQYILNEMKIEIILWYIQRSNFCIVSSFSWTM